LKYKRDSQRRDAAILDEVADWSLWADKVMGF
jgi:hypothetical protein